MIFLRPLSAAHADQTLSGILTFQILIVEFSFARRLKEFFYQGRCDSNVSVDITSAHRDRQSKDAGVPLDVLDET